MRVNNGTPISAALPKASIDWREIEQALVVYFSAARDFGDAIVDLEADPDWDNDCEDCTNHYVQLDLTDLARFIATELEAAP
jgi:hypothetical protein